MRAMADRPLIPIEPVARVPIRRPRSRGVEPMVPWVIGAIAAGALYFGRSVLIPITLAVLLSFLLAPIVAGLRRLRIPRSGAVILAMLLAIAGIGATGAVIVSQAATLSKDAPAYAEQITLKAASLRAGIQHRLDFLLRESGHGGSGNPETQQARREGAAAAELAPSSQAVPVEVRAPPPTALDEVRMFVLPALAPIETALIVLIVTLFILFQKEDLRDRLIRLMGTADLHRTTIALDDGAKRLSRYFLSQSVVNFGFGALIWIGLFLIGVPSPGLWGILAGLLRFIPYVGIFVAALGPLALAAAIDPGWGTVVYAMLLFLVVELVVGYLIEPLLYGHSTGLSPVSVVVAALFWTWIWGPLGLVLSMPVTLMLVVLGRHIPAFQMFDILLGDRPALSPAETFYQRVLAGHPDEALEEAEQLLEHMTLAAYYEAVVLGALRLAAFDVDRGVVERSAMHAVCETTVEVVHALADHDDGAARGHVLSPVTEASAADTMPETIAARRILCVAGRGPMDVAVQRVVAQVLSRAGCVVSAPARDPGGADFDPGNAELVFILGLFDGRADRRIEPVVRRIRAQRPDVDIVLGVRRSTDEASVREGSSAIAASLVELCRAVDKVGRSDAAPADNLESSTAYL